MQIIDKNFKKLPLKNKAFVVGIAFGFFLVGLIGFLNDVFTGFTGFLLFLIGMLLAEMIKLHYRINNLEKKKKR